VINKTLGILSSLLELFLLVYLIAANCLLNRTLISYCQGTAIERDRKRLSPPFTFFTFLWDLGALFIYSRDLTILLFVVTQNPHGKFLVMSKLRCVVDSANLEITLGQHGGTNHAAAISFGCCILAFGGR
jgi:hypothetical protein